MALPYTSQIQKVDQVQRQRPRPAYPIHAQLPRGNWLAQDQRSETTKSPARLTLYIPDPKNDQVKNSSPHWAYPTHVPNRLTPYMPDPRKRPSPPTGLPYIDISPDPKTAKSKSIPPAGLPYTYPRSQKRPSQRPRPPIALPYTCRPAETQRSPEPVVPY